MTWPGLEERKTSSGIRFASAGSALDFLPPISSPSASRLLGIGGATGGFGFTNIGGGILGRPPGGGGGGIPEDKKDTRLDELEGYISLTCQPSPPREVSTRGDSCHFRLGQHLLF